MEFSEPFKALTGYDPYPWQDALYQRFIGGQIPSNISLSTGTGKTSVIPVWLLALAQNPALPKRLVYVVDRRSVVDQATKVVEQLVERLPSVTELTSYLRGLSLEGEALLGVSTLRGEYQDNQEWSKFPFRPAVVVGTVDMVGSRLLFSGYGDGAYSRSLHAGLLGNDTLVVFDECHLVPAFENLLRMVKEAEGKLKPFHVLTMSATSNGEGSITLSEADLANTTINAKLTAHKALQLRDVAKPVPFIIKQALDNPPDRTIVFVNSPRVAAEIAAEIQKHCSKVAALTGTIRGKERDDLVDNPIFQTFTKAEKPVEPHCLVATSAGEVGIDLTCSRMITDMSSAASMVQRFGRANRFAEVDAVEIFVVFNSKDKKLKAYLWGDNDLDFIKSLDGDASCLNLYNKREELAALAKKVSVVPALEPTILNILSMTSLKHDIDISDYLRGKDLQSRYVEIAWRKEVDLLGKMSQADFDRYMQQMPLRSFERLSESAKRAAEVLTEALSKEDTQIVVVTPEADKLYAPLSEVIEMKLRDCTLILPENVGGLAGGMFAVENTDNAVLDIAEIEHKHHEPRVRIVCGAEENVEVTRTQKKIEFRVGDQKLVVIKEVQKKKYSRELLSDHNDAVSATAKLFAEKAGLFAELVAALEEAGRLHDTGKANPIWQVAAIGKLKTAAVAKGNGRFNAAALNGFRHEFESLELAEGMDELVKHVVAVHHAGARPTWIGERDLAPINTNPEAMREQIRRFAQLQQQWGWWGLAYLETILRSADGYVSEE